MKSERGKKTRRSRKKEERKGGKKAKIPSWRTKGLRGNDWVLLLSWIIMDSSGLLCIRDVESIVGIFLTFLQSFATCIDDV